MADFCLVFGLILSAIGVYQLAGAGWTSLVVGVVLFLAGGLDKVKR